MTAVETTRATNCTVAARLRFSRAALLPNTGIPLNLDWVREMRVNTSAVERRAQSQVARRTVKKEWQAAWLLRAITCMDLTTLSGDDTDERVRRLCAKGRHPLQEEIVKKLGIEELQIKVAAICVYHTFVETALHALEGSGIHVAAVSTGFPAGLSPMAERVAEIRRSVEAGAHEIDVVITRAHVFGGRWQALYDESAAFKQACGSSAHEGDPWHGRSADVAQRGARKRSGDDGGRRFHQDFNWQRADECDFAGGSGDDSRHPRICAANRNGRGLQAGGRHSYGEAIARLAGHDQRGAWASRGCGRRCFVLAPAVCWGISSGSWSIMHGERYSAEYSRIRCVTTGSG